MSSISIVTSSYNPDEEVFKRCLSAVCNLDRTGLETEYIIVDNNSSPPLKDRSYITELIGGRSWIKIISEKKAGASFGKVAGYRESKGDIVVFFDDDNEPDPDYLQAVKRYSGEFPTVGAFGPGEVRVVYMEAVEDWLHSYKYLFQHNLEKEEKHSISRQFEPHFPVGTGLVMRREAIEPYAGMLEDGSLRTTCRKGNSLSSGGDIQMVLLATKAGFEAGTTPRLRLNHLIPSKKANRQYLRRLKYGCAVSAIPARLEVFPDEKPEYAKNLMSSARGVATFAWVVLKHALDDELDFRIAEQLGWIHGYRDAFEKSRPFVTQKIARVLRLE